MLNVVQKYMRGIHTQTPSPHIVNSFILSICGEKLLSLFYFRMLWHYICNVSVLLLLSTIVITNSHVRRSL